MEADQDNLWLEIYHYAHLVWVDHLHQVVYCMKISEEYLYYFGLKKCALNIVLLMTHRISDRIF